MKILNLFVEQGTASQLGLLKFLRESLGLSMFTKDEIQNQLSLKKASSLLLYPGNSET